MFSDHGGAATGRRSCPRRDGRTSSSEAASIPSFVEILTQVVRGHESHAARRQTRLSISGMSYNSRVVETNSDVQSNECSIHSETSTTDVRNSSAASPRSQQSQQLQKLHSNNSTEGINSSTSSSSDSSSYTSYQNSESEDEPSPATYLARLSRKSRRDSIFRTLTAQQLLTTTQTVRC